MFPKGHLENNQIPAQAVESELWGGEGSRHNINQAVGFFFIILNWKRICVDLRKKGKLIEVYVGQDNVSL